MESMPLPEPRIWRHGIEADPLPILSDLSVDQRLAVLWAFKRWVYVAQREGYSPIIDWMNFANEVDHSALLSRLLSGKDALEKKPPTQYSCPVYPDDE